MTTAELKRSMDRRFDRLERTKVDKVEFRRFQRAMDRRFDRLERTKVDKVEFRRAIASLRTGLRGEIAASAAETRRYVDASADRLRDELRRHFDVVAEGIRDDIRIFADTVASHSDRLDRHDARIASLERRPS